MRQIKRLKAFVCALAGTALLSACSSEADEIINEAGKGYVSLSVQADAGFQTTRAASGMTPSFFDESSDMIPPQVFCVPG